MHTLSIHQVTFSQWTALPKSTFKEETLLIISNVSSRYLHSIQQNLLSLKFILKHIEFLMIFLSYTYIMCFPTSSLAIHNGTIKSESEKATLPQDTLLQSERKLP